MKLNINSVNLLAGAFSVCIFSACTSQETGPSVTNPNENSSDVNPQYVRERIALKSTVGRDEIDQRLIELDRKFGLYNPNSTESNNLQTTIKEKHTLEKAAGIIASGTYSPKYTARYKVWLVPGDSVEAWTSSSGSIDPVLVLAREGGMGENSFSKLQPQVITYVHAYNDDAPGEGLHSRIKYLVPTGEYHYGILAAFPYNTTSSSPAVRIRLRIKRNGYWSTVIDNTTYLNATIYKPQSSIVPSYVKTGTPCNSDTFIWVWNLSSVGANLSSPGGIFSDDFIYGNNCSDVSNTTVYPLAGGPLDVVVLSAYGNTNPSTVSWQHF